MGSEMCIRDSFGSADILVNNATPSGGTARFESMTDAAMNDYMSVNYYASFWAMQAVFPHMKSKGWGRIITMCSLNGINAHRYTVMYNASKEAARALTRTAAVEWGRYGITCNVLCPFAATPSWQGFEKFDPEGARTIVEKGLSGKVRGRTRCHGKTRAIPQRGQQGR